MPFVLTLKAALLDHVLLGPTYTPPTNWYVALSTTTPNDVGGNFTEPSGNGYVRVSVSGSTFGSAATGHPATKSNTTTITFPVASGSWGTITYWGLFTAASGGTVQIWAALTASVAVTTNQQVTLASGALVAEMGDPTDTF